ncbi:Ankyrin repeat domain containing protein [Pandoravirus macleodensis]|uniref:Ankyrin repeat domain containing protein n=1 Tax=Pandoravirus macleodensis TaxID=2107707 RepID=A0A2U7UG67_9VIRU|nr:Ankyrin repeat domain containing protein [Pandoravirus macleodensis]AVK77385.1 Ankyrin repeat domain containing protein [Pandoravirus macleodensis]
MASGDDLPNEILVLIFDGLPCPVLWHTARAVCRRWAAVVNDRTLALGRDERCFDRDSTLARQSRWCEAAAGVAHAHCMKYALLVGVPWDKETCAAAAGGGHLDFLATIHFMGCPWGPSLYARAAATGHMDCIEYARRHGCRWDETACRAAADAGRDDMLDYLIANGCPFDEDAASAAAGAGHLACLARLCAAGVALDADVYGEAVRSGSVSCLQCLEAHYCPRDPAAMLVAAGTGDTAVIAYLDSVGFVWDSPCSVRAVAGGHIDALTYAHERMGATLQDHLCRIAAARGQSDVLRWLFEHGCMPSEDTCRAAADGGHLNALVFLHERGCLRDATGSALTAATARGHMECANYLRARSRPKTPQNEGETLDKLDGPPPTKRRRESAAI